MFVKNKATVDFKYRKGDYVAVLKAGTVSQVDETKVSAKELTDCYGQRISVISLDNIPEPAAPKFVAPKAPAATDKVETVKREELNDQFIDKILGEIKEEAGNTEEKDPLEKAVEGVEAFLKGETDKLPEGAQLISDEEALKLAEQASKVAEVKATKEETEATEETETTDETGAAEEKAEATEETPKVKTTKATKGRRKKNS